MNRRDALNAGKPEKCRGETIQVSIQATGRLIGIWEAADGKRRVSGLSFLLMKFAFKYSKSGQGPASTFHAVF